MKFRGTNFLDIIHPARAEKRRTVLFVKILLYTVAAAVAISLIIVGIYFGTARKVYNLSETGKQNLELASAEISALNLEKAGFYLSEAENNFKEAEESFNKLKFLSKFPWIGNQYDAVAGLLRSGIETSSALGDLADVAREIMNVATDAQSVVGGIPEVGAGTSFAEISPEKKRELLQKLFVSPPRLQGAKAKIDLALLALDQIQEDKVAGQLLKVLGPVRETLIKIRNILVKAIPAAEILPQIAGYPSEKTYLFLLQNSDELRPTGGFIGTYGIVKVKDGEVETFDTDNIYALDGAAEKYLRVPPPAPLAKYLRVGAWFMRDSNWSPDFPTAAAKADWFYHAEGGAEKKIDAVIAVTPTIISDILRQIGNIEMDGETFTPDNLMDVLQYKVEKEYYEKGIPEVQRKDIVGKLGEIIFNRLANLPSSKWSSIFGVTEKALTEKQLLFWSKDEELQTIIAREGWSGKILDSDGDYLSVIDANLASLKTDGVMDRKINYSLSKDASGDIRAKVSITYKNNGTFTWKTTRYRTYTRVYVPAGSTLVGGSGMMENDRIYNPAGRPGKIDTGEEFSKTFFGAFISIEPGKEGTLSFEYVLPEKIKNQISGGSYKLFVQKQSGTIAHPLTLNLNFGKNIKQASPAEEERYWGDTAYKLQTDLKVDRQIEVRF
ncbi:DUF4012 domain-containing protein [Candidatus Falkowbacteria bacterium]|nr:DUF4012 domain-containing protein [Candidatus Falkowbacteria bacterium]